MSRVRSALVWDPAVTAYNFRPDHPFNPRRLELTVSLIEALVALSHSGESYFLHHLTKPRPRSFANLLTGMVVQFGVLGIAVRAVRAVALKVRQLHQQFGQMARAFAGDG